MNSTPEFLSDLTLERYLQGELPADQSRKILEEAERNDVLAKRIASLKESNRDILTTHPPNRMVREIQARLILEREENEGERKRTGNRAFRYAAIVLPAAAAVLFLITLSPVREALKPVSAAGSSEITRMKGMDPYLLIYRKEKDGIQRLESGDQARQHDVLQLSYVVGGSSFGVIFSIDGRRVITRHYPAEDWTSMTASPELEGSREISLPFAYELDDAPGFERFVFLSSTESFAMKPVARAIEELLSSPRENLKTGQLSLPAGIKQATFLLNKEVR